jgi:hypothetical protein
MTANTCAIPGTTSPTPVICSAGISTPGRVARHASKRFDSIHAYTVTRVTFKSYAASLMLKTSFCARAGQLVRAMECTRSRRHRGRPFDSCGGWNRRRPEIPSRFPQPRRYRRLIAIDSSTVSE